MLRKSILTPKNYGRTDRVASAAEELQWTLSRASAQYVEAINLDGVAVLFWKKTEEGNFCTCRYGKKLEAVAIGSDNLDLKEPVLGDGVDDGGGVINEPLPESIYTTRNQWDDVRTDPSLPKPIDRYSPSGEPIPPPPEEPVYQDDPDQLEDEIDFLTGPVDSDTLSGIEKSQCGICLGTGRTQAWNLFGGKREIFDSYSVREFKGFKIENEARPVSFKAPSVLTNYVEWHYTLPTYFNQVLNFAVRNNTKSVRYLKIFYKLAGSTDDFVRLDEAFLNSRKGKPTKLILRVQPIKENIGELEFTHMEISWELSTPNKIQMTPLQVASNSQIAAVATTSSFTFPPTFNNVDKDDVFLDMKYGYMWKVTDFTDFETASRQVLGWTVSARNLQAFEQQALLKVAYDKYYETSYSGLETIQGSLLSGSDML